MSDATVGPDDFAEPSTEWPDSKGNVVETETVETVSAFTEQPDGTWVEEDVVVRTASGRMMTEADFNALAEEAEAGYDVQGGHAVIPGGAQWGGDEPGYDVEPVDGPLYKPGLTPTRYLLPEGLSFDQWSAMGPPLVQMAQSAMWWVGDWLRYGEFHWGDKYTQAVEETGFSASTLKNAQWVADRIPPDERRVDVPFSHHKAVASLDRKPRNDLLRRAAEDHLSEYEVRTEVREMKAKAAAEPDGPPVPPEDPEPPKVWTRREAFAEALRLLDDALMDHDWRKVGEARAMVALAQELATVDASVE